MQKSVPTPVVVAVIVVVVLVVGVFLYKGLTGGQVSNGEAGKVEASPPMPNAQHQVTAGQAVQGR